MHHPVPTEPRSLTVDKVTDTTVTLSWIIPDPTNGEITQYELQYKSCADIGYNALQPLNNAVTRMVAGLSNNTEYCFRVRAYSIVSLGPGDWTDEVMGRTCKLHLIQVIIVI